jgi:hypothetical protein
MLSLSSHPLPKSNALRKKKSRHPGAPIPRSESQSTSQSPTKFWSLMLRIVLLMLLTTARPAWRSISRESLSLSYFLNFSVSIHEIRQCLSKLRKICEKEIQSGTFFAIGSFGSVFVLFFFFFGGGGGGGGG